MKALIRRCRDSRHSETVYTFGTTCPDCGGDTENTAPPRFSPGDAYGSYRRQTRWTR